MKVVSENKDFNPSNRVNSYKHSDGISIDRREYDEKQSTKKFIEEIISIIQSENLYASNCCGDMKMITKNGDSFGIIKRNRRNDFLGLIFKDEEIQVATLWIDNACREAKRKSLWILEVKMDYLVLCQKLADKFYSKYGIKILLRVE